MSTFRSETKKPATLTHVAGTRPLVRLTGWNAERLAMAAGMLPEGAHT
jgi:hypothetical protein